MTQGSKSVNLRNKNETWKIRTKFRTPCVTTKKGLTYFRKIQKKCPRKFLKSWKNPGIPKILVITKNQKIWKAARKNLKEKAKMLGPKKGQRINLAGNQQPFPITISI